MSEEEELELTSECTFQTSVLHMNEITNETTTV